MSLFHVSYFLSFLFDLFWVGPLWVDLLSVEIPTLNKQTNCILTTLFLLRWPLFRVDLFEWVFFIRIQPNGQRGMAEYQPEMPPEGRQDRGRCRGLVSSHTTRTIGLYPTCHHIKWVKRNVSVVCRRASSSNGKQWWSWRSRSVNDSRICSRPAPGPDLFLVALFVYFGRRSSIRTSRSSSYSGGSRFCSLGLSPFELISEYHRWQTAFHRPFSFEFFQLSGMA